MTFRLHTAEQGVVGATPTDNDILTTTAPENAFDTAVIGANTKVIYTDEQKAHGSRSIKITPVGSESAALKWTVESHTQGAASFYIYLTALPTIADGRLIYLGTGTASTLVLRTISTGALRMAGSGTSMATSPVLPTATWLRIDISYDQVAQTARFTVAKLDDTTLVYDSGVVAGNLGTTAFDSCRFGLLGTPAATFPVFYLDTMRFNSGSNAMLTPYGLSAPPVVKLTAASASVKPGGTVQITSTSDQAGTYTWRTSAGDLVVDQTGKAVTLKATPKFQAATAIVILSVLNSTGQVGEGSVNVDILKAGSGFWNAVGFPDVPTTLLALDGPL